MGWVSLYCVLAAIRLNRLKVTSHTNDIFGHIKSD
ncbi:hypothetical protein PMI17_00138 [Pantoea sp. GM01]|nr:hypothetical protein PMI17_00138 [Pantoea sp. GM01]